MDQYLWELFTVHFCELLNVGNIKLFLIVVNSGNEVAASVLYVELKNSVSEVGTLNTCCTCVEFLMLSIPSTRIYIVTQSSVTNLQI
jgi:hypothetical protein